MTEDHTILCTDYCIVQPVISLKSRDNSRKICALGRGSPRPCSKSLLGGSFCYRTSPCREDPFTSWGIVAWHVPGRSAIIGKRECGEHKCTAAKWVRMRSYAIDGWLRCPLAQGVQLSALV